jgi:hypothetical protein
MRRLLSACLGLAMVFTGLVGCGTISIPQVAAQGTTIMIPVPDGFGAGFGRVLNQYVDPASHTSIPPDLNSPLEDFQRGELLFALRTGPTLAGSSLVTYLPVRFITRVHIDEATGAALPAPGESYLSFGTPVQAGQTLALVDIPYVTQPGTYYVFAERWKRSPTSPYQFAPLSPVIIEGGYAGWNPWLSWADWTNNDSRSDRGFEIRVVASSHGASFHEPPRGFNKWSANQNYAWREFSEDLEYLMPHPKLRIWIGNPPTFPAAFEATLAYPAGKLEITGATLGRRHRSGGLVSVSTETDSGTSCETPGTAQISLVDPERLTQWVDVVYRIRDFEDCGRAVPGDFSIVTGSPKAYDPDGSPISPIFYLDPEYSF